MHRVRPSFFVCVGILLLASGVAGAQIPNPASSTVPVYIALVGCDAAGLADPRGGFRVTVRDQANNSIPGAAVDLIFNADVCIYDNNTGYIGMGRIQTVTDANGVASFDISGAGRNTSGAGSYLGADAVTIVATTAQGSATLGVSDVCTYDENGAALPSARGVEILDLAGWVADYQRRGLGNRPRSDFSMSGALDVLDLSIWVSVYNRRDSRFPCSGICE